MVKGMQESGGERGSPPFRSFSRDENGFLVFGVAGFVVIAITGEEFRQGFAITVIATIHGVTVEID